MTMADTATETVEDIDEALAHLAAVPYRRETPEKYAAWRGRMDRLLDKRMTLTRSLGITAAPVAS